MRNTALILSLFAALVLSSYWYAGLDAPHLDAAERTELLASGEAHSFVDLSAGTVHFRDEGPQSGPTVLLVHGFATPSFVWNDHIAPLTQAGFRVLTFDNYGRGYSDRPDAPYTADLTDQLILDLLEARGITRPVHLVGYSMGGPTSAVFASRHPEKVRSLSLIAPAGLAGEPDVTAQMMMAPVIGDFFIRLFGHSLLDSRAARVAQESPDPAAFLARYRAQARYQGYSEALLSTLRHYPLSDARTEYEAVGSLDLPVQILWGEEDTRVPFVQSVPLRTILPDAAFHPHPEAGHSLPFAFPDIVNTQLRTFIEANRIRQTSGGIGGKARGPAARMEPAICDCKIDG